MKSCKGFGKTVRRVIPVLHGDIDNLRVGNQQIVAGKGKYSVSNIFSNPFLVVRAWTSDLSCPAPTGEAWPVHLCSYPYHPKQKKV